MLKNNEPYRYAQPRLTQDKLARLRIKVTGTRRKTGPRKGQPPSPAYGTGKRTRTELALQTVYEQEQIPAATSYERLKSAERRMLKQNDIDNFAQAIQRPQTTERIRSRTTKNNLEQAV